MIQIQELDLKYIYARFGKENVVMKNNTIIIKSDMSSNALRYIEEKTILDFVKIKIDAYYNTNYVFSVTDNTLQDKLYNLIKERQ